MALSVGEAYVLPPLALLEVVEVKAPGDWEYLPGKRINQPLIVMRVTIHGLGNPAAEGGREKATFVAALPLALSVPAPTVERMDDGIGVYTQLLRMAIADGGLAAEENAQLEEARHQHGISWEQHHHLMNEVTNGTGVVRVLDSEVDQDEGASKVAAPKGTTLAQWLEANKMSALLKPLQEFGAETVDDLLDLDDEDLIDLESGLKKLQIKRLRRRLKDLCSHVVQGGAI